MRLPGFPHSLFLHRRLRQCRVAAAVENILRDAQPQRNTAHEAVSVKVASTVSGKTVEHPVYAEVDAADAVLHDHSPQTIREIAGVLRAHCALVVHVYAIKFFRDQSQPVEQVVGMGISNRNTVEQPCHVQRSCPERGVARWISREGRSEIFLARLVGLRCPQWQPAHVAAVRDVVFTRAIRSHRGVVFPDAHYRSPDLVLILVSPRQDARIGHRHIHQREQTSVLVWAITLFVSHFADDLVVQARRGTQFGSSVIAPVDADQGFIFGPFVSCIRYCPHQFWSNTLVAHFIQRVGVLRLIDGRRRWRIQTVAGSHREALRIFTKKRRVVRLAWVIAVFSMFSLCRFSHLSGASHAVHFARVGVVGTVGEDQVSHQFSKGNACCQGSIRR